MASKSKKANAPTINRNLDEFEAHLMKIGNKDTSVAACIRDIYSDPQPNVERINAAVGLLQKDPRFILSGNGILSHIRVATANEIAAEPEEIAPDEVGASETVTPAAAAAPDPTPTLGEMVDKAKAEEAARPAVAPIDPKHSAEHVQMIRVANDLYRTCEADETRCSKQLSVLRKKRKEAAFHLSEVIGGQASILDVNGDVRCPPPSQQPPASKAKASKAAKPKPKAKAPTPPKPQAKPKKKSGKGR